MANRWFMGMIRFRWYVIASALLITFAAGWGVNLLQMKSDYREFFSESDPNRTSFDRLQNTYTQSDAVLFVIAPTDGQVFQNDVLQMVEELTADAWLLPYSLRVDSITNFQHTQADEDGLLVGDLVEDASGLDAAKIAAIQDIALNEKLLYGRLITEAVNVTGVAATINFPGVSNDEFGEVAQAARELAARYRLRYPNITIYLSGMVMGNSANTEVIEKDAGLLVPLMGGIVLFALFLLLRSFHATLATLLIILSTLVSALGLTGWLGFSITGPSSAAPVIILTMAVADCVHILVSYFFLLRQQRAKTEAIVESLTMNLGPIFLTSLTTAIGFLSMNFSDSPPFPVLGTASAMGVSIAFSFSIYLLPALMAILPLKQKEPSAKNDVLLSLLAKRVTKHAKAFFWGITFISIALFSAIPKNEVNDQFTKFFDPSVDFRQAVDFSNEHLIGVSSIEYGLVSPYEGGVNNPAFLQSLDRFNQWLLTQAEVKHVSSLSDTMKRLNRDMHAGDDSWYKTPSNRELASQYLLLYEMSLPFGLDMTNQIDFDKKETRVVISLQELSTNEILAVEARINHWLETELPDVNHYNSSGALMFAHISVDNAHSSLISTTFALCIISLILALALRSTKMGLVSLIVNILPGALAFGIWGLLVGQVGISIATSVGMTLGIVVDNTVHFLSKYLHAKNHQAMDGEAAIQYAFSHVGSALLVCNAVLIAGFLVLSLSDFTLNRDMGLFAVLTFVLALIVDFLFLPTILLWLDRHKGENMTKLNENYGPWALVTGASSGIGKALCEQLAQQGLNIVAVARSESNLALLKQDLESEHDITVKTLSQDLSHPESNDIIAEKTAHLDIGLLVANAGVGADGLFTDNNINDEHTLVALNIASPMALSHIFSQRFSVRGKSGILLVSSLVGYQGVPYFANYAASKAYLLSLGEALHVELKPLGIDVTVVSPGFTKTSMFNAMDADVNKMPMTVHTPEVVAKIGINALGRKATVVVGNINKMYAWGNRFMPRAWTVKLFGLVIGRARVEDKAPNSHGRLIP